MQKGRAMKKHLAGISTLKKSLVFLLTALVLTVACPPEGAAVSSYAEAVGIMKREQTLGEAGAGLLKTFLKDDVAVFAQGIQLYATAQADFNKLLETLKAALIEGDDLADSKRFQEALDLAVKRRVAFTDFVEKKVLSRTQKGSRSFAAVLGSANFLKGAAELFTALKEAGLDIWRAYRAADKEHRQQIRDQLDSLMWRSFEKVPALG